MADRKSLNVSEETFKKVNQIRGLIAKEIVAGGGDPRVTDDETVARMCRVYLGEKSE